MLRNIIERAAQTRREREAAGWLARLHADDCDERTRARFRQWLRADAMHAAVFEELTAVWELVGARAPQHSARPAQLTRRRVLLSGGAALTAAAGGFVALSAGAEVYRTDIGERRSIVLADRSKVLLDANSDLRVRSRDSGCEATLQRGRAHFDLSARTSGSLVVRAGGCNLRIDRGAFEVETREGQAARFLMLSGAGDLHVEDGGAQVKSLASGHMFDESSTAVTPDLNYVSVDGIGMISVANGGSGQRRVDLALIPSQASRTTEVFKTFTADLDSGAIGGVINIVPYSAFDGGDKFFIDTFASFATYDDVPGGNSVGGYDDSPWGGGIKQLWSQRFGSDDQFGIVVSSVYQQRTYDETKRNPNGRTYYSATGASTTPISPDYNGYDPAPQAFVSYDFTNFVENYGGSALLEFSPSSAWYSSLMLYDYRQLEDQTLNAPTLRAFTGLTGQTQTTGTLRIPDVRTTCGARWTTSSTALRCTWIACCSSANGSPTALCSINCRAVAKCAWRTTMATNTTTVSAPTRGCIVARRRGDSWI